MVEAVDKYLDWGTTVQKLDLVFAKHFLDGIEKPTLAQ